MKRWLLFIPALFILALAIALFLGISQDPLQKMKSHLNQPLPAFSLLDLYDHQRHWQNQDFPQNQVFLIKIGRAHV